MDNGIMTRPMVSLSMQELQVNIVFFEDELKNNDTNMEELKRS